jgi:UDP-N-acetylglucosamine 2-epimerase (non-hydrolysing)
MMHVLHVVGARPNFMKVAPVLRALEGADVRQTLIHTGQHYDASMSEVFFQQLEMRAPDVNLEVGSGTHAAQTAEVMIRIEPVLARFKPDFVLVYGDVNSTMAAALVCSKLGLRVGHVEAGLRSRDRSMPEEINRLVTDQLSDFLFTPSEDADDNLRREGIPGQRIFRAGNVMIDTLMRLLPRADAVRPAGVLRNYILVTLHRPSNVDDSGWLAELLAELAEASHGLEVLFPVHPRTRQRIHEFGLETTLTGRVKLLDPLPYLEFLALQKGAAVVITDSGGIQEETTFLGVPCLTVRENTERPITVKLGTNRLVGRNASRLRKELRAALASGPSPKVAIPLWDGHAAERIAQFLLAQ